MIETDTDTTVDEETGWCPTCGQRTAPWLEAGVGPAELQAILDAIAKAAPVQADAQRIIVRANNVFTRDYSTFHPCGHACKWKRMAANFYVSRGDEGFIAVLLRSELGPEVCPICLPSEIERGEIVLVNPEEIERVIRYETGAGEWDEEAPAA